MGERVILKWMVLLLTWGQVGIGCQMFSMIFFKKHNKKISDYYDLVKLDPGFSIYYEDKNRLDVPESYEELKKVFESIENGSSEKLEKFIKRAEKKYEIGVKNLVYKPSKSFLEFLNIKVIKGAFHLDIFTVFSKYVRKIFQAS